VWNKSLLTPKRVAPKACPKAEREREPGHLVALAKGSCLQLVPPAGLVNRWGGQEGGWGVCCCLLLPLLHMNQHEVFPLQVVSRHERLELGS